MPDDSENLQNRQETPTLAELYPDYSEEELAEAEQTLHRYIDLVWRIFRRLKSEGAEKVDENPFKR